MAPLHKTFLPAGGKAAGSTSSILVILLQTPSAEHSRSQSDRISAGGSINCDSSSSWHTQIQGNVSEDGAPRSVTAELRKALTFVLIAVPCESIPRLRELSAPSLQ